MKEQTRITTGKLIAGLVIAILLSCAVSTTVCSCAEATTVWIKTYGGTGTDIGGGDIIQTGDGGYVISGDTSSFGAGGVDAWLIKTDAFGEMQWNKTYGGALDDSPIDMCETIDGGYALGGYTNSSGAGNSDFWLVKIDANGNIQWNMTYGGTSVDYGFSVIQTSDGGYAMTGYTASFGAGGYDFWLVKTNATGNLQWNMTYGGTGIDYGYAIVQTSDGGYALTGRTNSFGAGSSDAWLIKTDSNGVMQWNMTYGTEKTDESLYLIQTSDGGYAMTGYTASFSAGGVDAFLFKTDANGNLLWNKTYGGASLDEGMHLIQTTEGGYAIIGLTMSFGAGSIDAWLIKTDASGNLLWNKTYGGTNMEVGYGLIQTSDGGYAIAGDTNSFGAGSKDFYIMKTDELGEVPEYSSWLIPSLVLTATAFILIHKKKLLRKR